MTGITPLSEIFATVHDWLEGAGAEAPAPSAADEIAALFGLDPFGRNLLLLCAFTALEPEAQNQMTALVGDPGLTAPTVGVALARCPGANWAALGIDAPLRRWGLIRIQGDGVFTTRRIHIAEPVLFHLLGAPNLGASTSLLRPLPDPGALAPNRAALASDILRRMGLDEEPVLHLIGKDPEGKLLAFARAAAEAGFAAYALPSQLLPGNAADLPGFTTTLARDLRLAGGHLVLSHDSDAPLAALFAETFPDALAIASAEPLIVGHRLALRLEMPIATAAQQMDIWRLATKGMKPSVARALPALAATFRVAPETAAMVAAEARLEEDKTAKERARTIWEGCRRAARPRMDDLAQRVTSNAKWDDLILPERQKATLAGIIAQVRNRTQVYEDWGFAPRLQNKGLGISALLAGPSGAGKSMAGEVIGNALDLDVYRVDLSALVSKWVGETEKNLKRVFDAAEDGGIILQFDEADALFGKRSEVKDSHDRHANMEVSYLLQRLEAYRGLSILTTNMRDNIDEAFLRRIRFIVDFRFPGRIERRAIWKRIFPAGMPIGKVDYERLSQLNVAGGAIRNIALGASFLAADRGNAVTMAELYQAALLEYDKVGRSMTDAERAGWLQ